MNYYHSVAIFGCAIPGLNTPVVGASLFGKSSSGLLVKNKVSEYDKSMPTIKYDDPSISGLMVYDGVVIHDGVAKRVI